MMFKLMLLYGCLLSVYFESTDACSCAIAHPQQKYCTSDFAVKATVGNRRTVIIGRDGKVTVLDKKGLVKTTKETAEEGSGSVDDSSFPSLPLLSEDDMFAGERPNFISEARGPDSRIPGYAPHFKNIDAKLSEAFQFHRAKRAASLRRKNNRKNRIYGSRVLGNLRKSPNPPARSELPEGKRMYQYTITILKDYKETLNGEKRQFMYTPPMCSVNLKKNHTVYLLMGKLFDGKMEMNTCDYKAKLNDLDESERQNLLQNLRFRYKCGPQECQITVCNRQNCRERQPRTLECMWLDWTTIFHPKASQFACKKKKDRCIWLNSADKDSQPEDIQTY